MSCLLHERGKWSRVSSATAFCALSAPCPLRSSSSGRTPVPLVRVPSRASSRKNLSYRPHSRLATAHSHAPVPPCGRHIVRGPSDRSSLWDIHLSWPEGREPTRVAPPHISGEGTHHHTPHLQHHTLLHAIAPAVMCCAAGVLKRLLPVASVRGFAAFRVLFKAPPPPLRRSGRVGSGDDPLGARRTDGRTGSDCAADW